MIVKAPNSKSISRPGKALSRHGTDVSVTSNRGYERDERFSRRMGERGGKHLESDKVSPAPAASVKVNAWAPGGKHAQNSASKETAGGSSGSNSKPSNKDSRVTPKGSSAGKMHASMGGNSVSKRTPSRSVLAQEAQINAELQTKQNELMNLNMNLMNMATMPMMPLVLAQQQAILQHQEELANASKSASKEAGEDSKESSSTSIKIDKLDGHSANPAKKNQYPMPPPGLALAASPADSLMSSGALNILNPMLMAQMPLLSMQSLLMGANGMAAASPYGINPYAPHLSGGPVGKGKGKRSKGSGKGFGADGFSGFAPAARYTLGKGSGKKGKGKRAAPTAQELHAKSIQLGDKKGLDIDLTKVAKADEEAEAYKQSSEQAGGSSSSTGPKIEAWFMKLRGRNRVSKSKLVAKGG